MNRLFFLFGFLLFQFSLLAQMEPFLLLEKPGKEKSRIRYYAGSEIMWKFKDDKTVYNSSIMLINDSAFVTDKGLNVPYWDLDMILLPAGGVIKGIGSMAYYAIPPIIVLDALNNIFNTGRTPVVSDEALYISAIFGSITVISWMMPKNKKKKLNKRWRFIPIIH